MSETPVIRVVVVDDEPDICMLLELQFETAEGFEVVGTASNGEQAVDLVRDTQADAVVMDLLMAGTNGFASIAALQADYGDVGIVAYTGVAGEFVRQEMERRGVEVVLKSGDIEPLAEAIRRSVDARRP